MPDTIESVARRAREASFSLAGVSLEARNRALEAIAREIESRVDDLLAVNAVDVEVCQGAVAGAGPVPRELPHRGSGRYF